MTKVCYKGKDDDFVVMAESSEAVEKFRKDPTVPLVDVVNNYTVYCTHK